jgi:hypothetical protein
MMFWVARPKPIAVSTPTAHWMKASFHQLRQCRGVVDTILVLGGDGNDR